jgi:hypothetical protein
MPSVGWKHANSASNSAGPILCRQSRIEQLANGAVRSQEVEPDVYWVVLNLPHQTSRTLYLGTSEAAAALIEETARGAVAHALEYALGSAHS